MKLTKEFVEKFNRWAEVMTESGEMTMEGIEETKEAIRKDAEDGPDQIRNEGHQIATAEERIAHWVAYFDWWIDPMVNGINERIKRTA